jgi:hypothetical protein
LEKSFKEKKDFWILIKEKIVKYLQRALKASNIDAEGIIEKAKTVL